MREPVVDARQGDVVLLGAVDVGQRPADVAVAEVVQGGVQDQPGLRGGRRVQQRDVGLVGAQVRQAVVRATAAAKQA